MKHFLAYGNADQASFRDDRVRSSFNLLTVPGTIAAFYADATAGFVLSSELPYIIEPRTPLFQNVIQQPRASHFALAESLGPRLASLLGDPQVKRAVRVPPSFFDDVVAEEVARHAIEFQRSYGGRAPQIQERLDRYAQLLAEARGQDYDPGQAGAARPPEFVLAPYFVFESPSDQWWEVNERVWGACTTLPDPEQICPVIAVDGLTELGNSLDQAPPELSSTQFVWVTQMDERKLSRRQLDALWSAISSASVGRRLTNLYGGFFSICLSYAGLWGFNNGLGYSESRSWPELPHTGAAPPRYYLRDLHLYLPPALAQHVVEVDESFRCPCDACDRPPVSMGFHQLKAHFALARRWELDLVSSQAPNSLADVLEEAAERFESEVQDSLPPRTTVDTTYLDRWAATLRRA